MTPVNLIITLPELERVAEALEALAQSKTPQEAPAAAAVVSVAPTPAAPDPAPTLEAPAPAPEAARTYTLDALISAATKLVDGGKREELRTLLEMLGAQSLATLPPDKYAAFAEGLRKLGADL